MSYRCHGCGRCCQGPVEISQQEYAAAPFGEYPVWKLSDGHVIFWDCPFYDGDCSIYDERFATCRNYLCYRKSPQEPFLGRVELERRLATDGEAKATRDRLRQEALAWAQKHGWTVEEKES